MDANSSTAKETKGRPAAYAGWNVYRDIGAGLSPGARGIGRAVRFIEVAAVFLLGYLAMSFFQYHPKAEAGADAGLPGNDSFYHVKMASMLPEVGLVKKFPWLQYSYFTQQGDDFVSHHYGFHALMVPFVKLATLLNRDDLSGGRWAICTCFALVVVFFYLILRREQVPWRGLWVLLFFAMPIQFYTRHSYIRAISPSLMMMFILVWVLFERRWLLAFLVTSLFNHMYLGAVMYSPVIVACFAASCVFGRREDREFPWKVVLASATGWVVGVLTYPYFGGMLEFLKLQVLGTGLNPDIEVGTEWKPYEGVWWFGVQFAGPILGIWALSLVTRLRLGPRLTANELTLVLLHFAFLVLTLKARRFIEYWPAFCMLSAGLLSWPAVVWAIEWIEEMFVRVKGVDGLIGWVMWIGAALSVTVWFYLQVGPKVGGFWSELRFSPWFWTAIGIGLLSPVLTGFLSSRLRDRMAFRRCLIMLPMCLMLVTVTSVSAATMWVNIRQSNKCSYDVAEIRKMMAALKADSQPGDVVFTSDWDDFPVYFYYNTYNYFIVGLDPKFTHERRPDLWERYVRVTRGQVPTDREIMMKDAKGVKFKQMLKCRVEDIRDHFHAKYVISDRDHTALSSKVASAKDFADLIYPEGGWAANRNAPYVVFRIRPTSTPESAPAGG